MVNNLIFLHRLITSMGCPRFNSSQLGVDLDILSGILEYIVYVKHKYKFSFRIPFSEKLFSGNIGSVAKHIAKNQANILVKCLIWHVFKVWVHSFGLDVLSEPLRCSENQVVHQF